MLYITCDHYYNDDFHLNNVPMDEKKECFICLDTESKNKDIIKLNMTNIVGYLKKCDCDGDTHFECLQKWYKLHNKCPICRQTIENSDVFMDNSEIIIHSYHDYLFYNVIHNIIYNFMFAFKVTCFFYCIYAFYNSILHLRLFQ
jgi:hypothetical protein